VWAEGISIDRIVVDEHIDVLIDSGSFVPGSISRDPSFAWEV